LLRSSGDVLWTLETAAVAELSAALAATNAIRRAEKNTFLLKLFFSQHFLFVHR
jgi:hypothetical protein